MESERVLIFLDYYLPGYKAGGPIRTLAAMVDRVGDRFAFSIITRDRDFGDEQSYAPEAMAQYQEDGARARCRYLAPGELGPLTLRAIVRQTPHDVQYVNSLFSRPLGMTPVWLRFLGLIPRRPLVVAPRGELNPGALNLSARRKRIYLAVARTLGVYSGVTWHVTSATEARHVTTWFGQETRIQVAPNLVALPPPRERVVKRRPDGPLRIAFVSRISPMKNLVGALHILEGVKAEVGLDIYGPQEDIRYWRRCEILIQSLPPNVKAIYQGPLIPEKVPRVLAERDLLFLPTLGENFGHVILEALLAGCPVLISDRTPWRGLEARGVGWDIPLEDPGRFRQVIDAYATTSPAVRAKCSRAARQLGREYATDERIVEQTARLFLAQADLGSTGVDAPPSHGFRNRDAE